MNSSLGQSGQGDELVRRIKRRTALSNTLLNKKSNASLHNTTWGISQRNGSINNSMNLTNKSSVRRKKSTTLAAAKSG